MRVTRPSETSGGRRVQRESSCRSGVATHLCQAGQGHTLAQSPATCPLGRQRTCRSNQAPEIPGAKAILKYLHRGPRAHEFSPGQGHTAHTYVRSWVSLRRSAALRYKSHNRPWSPQNVKEKTSGWLGCTCGGSLQGSIRFVSEFTLRYFTTEITTYPYLDSLEVICLGHKRGKLYKWGNDKYSTPHTESLARCHTIPFLCKKSHNYFLKPSDSRETIVFPETVGFQLKGHQPSTEIWRGKKVD